MKIAFLAALLFVGVAIPCIAADSNVPPTPKTYVTDTASVLSPGTQSNLESELRAYEKATGHQVIVWTGQTTGSTPLEDWTAQTAQRWHIGTKKHDDGAVLFLFMQDHKVRIEVGYGLESSLPDASAKRIIDEQIRPRMRLGDADGAVTNGINAMLLTITPSFKGASPPPAAGVSANDTNAAGWITVLFLVLMFAFPIAFIVLVALIVARAKHESFKKAFHDGWFYGGSGTGFSSGGFSGGGFSGGFSSGGGSFGGGGASGGW